MNEKTIYALGFFDGVHRGHQELLRQCRCLADRLGCRSAAITFDRHPQALFTADPPALINTAPDRAALLRSFSIDHVCILPVTREVMSKPWEEFLLELVDAGAEGFVCGSDFRFGHRGEGNAAHLQHFCASRGLLCTIVPEQTLDGLRISSTHIRALLEDGDMEEAVRFLGHPHILSGEVVDGRHLGRTIGVPTANILLSDGIVVPKLGVYACRVWVDGRSYPAVTNIGSRPTVDGHQTRAESWLLDFDGDLYGKRLTVEFFTFLRPERKFPSLEELQAQIRLDAEKARRVLD